MRRSLPLLALAASCVAACGRSAPVTRVVVVTLDTTRADRLGCYGYAGGTSPHLDALAAESALFEHAVSPVPTTLPAHSSLFTGLYPQDHGVRYNLVYRLGPEAVTLAELLRDAGFATAGFPAAHVVTEGFGLEQGFQSYPGPPKLDDLASHEREILVSNGIRATEIVDRAIAWLDAHEAAPRSFVWVHLYDAHAPYEPPFPYSSTFREHPYDGEIAYADAQLGRLLDRLRASSQWKSTLVVVAADHGEGLHDHRERYHANLLYETTQHVPLIVRAPRASARRVAEPVSLVDLMPTILDYAGLAARPGLRGRSLVPALEGRTLEPHPVYFESLAGSLNYGWEELRGVRSGSSKLIESRTPELFDLAQDPGETDDLAARDPARLDALRATLAELEPSLSSTSTAEAVQEIVEPDEQAFLASLGYVTGGAGGSASEASHPKDLIDLEPELLAGQKLVAAHDWKRLEEVTRFVLTRDPRNKWALENLITALGSTNRWKEAQDLAAKMIEIYPDGDRGYIHLAQSYKAQGDVKRAREVAGEGLKHASKSLQLRYVHLIAGFDLKLPAVCSGEVAEAVTRHPKSGLIRVLVARCAAMAGDTKGSIAALEKAVELGFDDVAGLEKAEDFGPVARTPEFARLIRSTAEPSPSPATASKTP
jgi:arylsulfatase A-like enzyme